MKAVVLFSGGQDSSTCLAWAKKNFKEVFAIAYDYGQKHYTELQQARIIASAFNIPMEVVDLGKMFQQLTNSALVHEYRDVSKLNEKGLPDSFVPNRNLLFLTLAHTYAQKIGAQAIVIGACETDYSGYPDCRGKFMELFERTANSGSDSTIQVITPLMRMTKKQIWALADELGVLDTVRKYSHTCYNGVRKELHDFGYGCGECPACLLRKNGYEEYQREKSSGSNSGIAG